MPTILACPEETDLLALALGEPGLAEVAAHVDGCAGCQKRFEHLQAEVASLQAEVALLRANQSEISLSPSTCPSAASEATSDLEFACASVDNPGATASWEFDDMAGDRAPIPPTETVDDDAGSRSDEPPLPPAIGKYLVVGRFARSGQAEVFRVVHPQFQQERVLKLAKEPVGADGRSEIIEEGKILSEMDHPHLIRVYDLDFLGDRPYLVMEFIRGRNLEQFAVESHVAPRLAAALVAKVAGAAAFAHRRGIVHRDIKPKNILVDEAGEPRLIDFGMARLRTAWSDDRREPDGGTFAFMAPEQARIDSPEDRQKVGPRSDVFALGAVLYSLLTGRAPFHGATWTEAWDRARRCAYDAGALNDRKIPTGLRRICLKAMAAEPAERYASAEALQKALNRYVTGPKILAVAVGLVGLALFSGLAYAFAPPRLVVETSRDRDVIERKSPPVIAGPLKGRIDLLVVKSKDGTRRRLRLENPGAVPVRADDEFRIEARLDRPAYLYLFWVGSEGKVAPLYPWIEHDWSQRPTEEQKVTGAELPKLLDDVLAIPASPPGLETLVLLAREDSPLPREDEIKLAEGLSGTPVRLPSDLTKAIWIEDGEEVTFELTTGLKKGPAGDDVVPRSIPSPKTRKSDDPVLRIRALLNEKVKPLGSYSQAVLFPNQGGS
jgi:serine/threonine protein kinase